MSAALTATYQIQVYGERERVALARAPSKEVYVTTPKTTIPKAAQHSVADGATNEWTATGDTKLRGAKGSFLDPASLDPRIQQIAIKRMDETLRKCQMVVESTGPARVVEMVTNAPTAAAFIEWRMRELHITGYVRLVPFEP